PLVELADGQQPGVTGELARRRLDDERRAEEVQDLGPGGWYTHGVSRVAEQTCRLSRLDARGRSGSRRLSRTAGGSRCAGPASLSGVPMSDVTQILDAIEQGDPKAAEQLLPLVYDELRKLAAQRLAQEKPGQTLQATALVHEAYLRLVGAEK